MKMRVLLGSLMWLALTGCGGEQSGASTPAAPTPVSQPASSNTAGNTGEVAESAKTLGAETARRPNGEPRVLSDAKRDSAPSEKRSADARGAKETRTRIAPPKGMEVHKDFVGPRVGLIQTANVMGEVDPCG